MKKKLMNAGWVVVMFLLMVVVHTPSVKGAISCGAAVNTVSPCVPYLRNGGAIAPKCCVGVRSLNSAAKTIGDRQALCRCLKGATAGASGVNPARLQGLPKACGVSLPYAISPSIDCSRVR